jgi:hypothetical protein
MKLHVHGQKPGDLKDQLKTEKRLAIAYRHTTVALIEEVVDVEKISPPIVSTGRRFTAVKWIQGTPLAQVRRKSYIDQEDDRVEDGISTTNDHSSKFLHGFAYLK